jgi:hypothetical protein
MIGFFVFLYLFIGFGFMPYILKRTNEIIDALSGKNTEGFEEDDLNYARHHLENAKIFGDSLINALFVIAIIIVLISWPSLAFNLIRDKICCRKT